MMIYLHFFLSPLGRRYINLGWSIAFLSGFRFSISELATPHTRWGLTLCTFFYVYIHHVSEKHHGLSDSSRTRPFCILRKKGTNQFICAASHTKYGKGQYEMAWDVIECGYI